MPPIYKLTERLDVFSIDSPAMDILIHLKKHCFVMTHAKMNIGLMHAPDSPMRLMRQIASDCIRLIRQIRPYCLDKRLFNIQRLICIPGHLRAIQGHILYH